MNVNLPPRPDRIKINGQTGQIIQKNETKPRSIEQKPRTQLEQTEFGQTVGKEIGIGTKTKTTENGLNGIDDALNRAIERAAISAIEKHPELIQDAVVDLIAKKLKDKLKNL